MKPLAPPIWWTWDHSTNWVLNQFGKQTYGASNYYSKEPDSFVEDYARAIRWAARHGIGAICIAGLLRDSHGGIEAARKVAQIGEEEGVRICGVAGLVSYGGIYYEGDSQWSLEKFLRENPDCAGVTADGRSLVKDFGVYGPRLTRHGCSSNPKLMAYILRSVEWLFRTIPELGGLQFETGDTGVCQCEKCRRRRILPADNVSLDDMALYYPKVVETILAAKPDAWAICETYHNFLPKRLSEPTDFGRGFPPAFMNIFTNIPGKAFFQWVCDEWLKGEWQEGAEVPLPGYRHIMRAHFGTYWWGSSRHRLEIENIRRMCRLSASSNLYCVSLFGEGAAYNANDEFNYLAQVYFSAHPVAGINEFIRVEMAPRLGGEERAADYIKRNTEAVNGVISEETFASIAANAGKVDAEARRRWLWLGSYIGAIKWDMESSKIQKR